MPNIYPSVYRRRLLAGGTGLTRTDILLLTVLAELSAVALADGWVVVTQAQLAQRAGLARKTVQRRMPVCEAAGWVDIRKTVRDGRYRAAAYRIRTPDAGPVRGTQSPTVHGTQSPTVHGTQSPRAGDTESQRLRSKSLGDADGTAPSGDGCGAWPGSWRDLPPKHPGTTPLLDDLGIRRRSRRGA